MGSEYNKCENHTCNETCQIPDSQNYENDLDSLVHTGKRIVSKCCLHDAIQHHNFGRGAREQVYPYISMSISISDQLRESLFQAHKAMVTCAL